MKKIITLLTVLISMGLCFACKPTPQNEIVINKNDGKLEETIGENSSTVTSKEKKYDTNAKGIQSNMEETVKYDTFTEIFDNGVNTIDVNAQVIRPNNTDLPVATVAKKSVSQSDVEKFIGYFLGENELFNPDEIASTTNVIEEVMIPNITKIKEELGLLKNYDSASEEEKKTIEKLLTETGLTREKYIEQLEISLTNSMNALEDTKEMMGKEAGNNQDNLQYNKNIEVGAVQVAAKIHEGYASGVFASNQPSGGSLSYRSDCNITMLDIMAYSEEMSDAIVKLNRNDTLEIIRDCFDKMNLDFVDFDRYIIEKDYATTFTNPKTNAIEKFRVFVFNDSLNGIRISNYASMLAAIADTSHEENQLKGDVAFAPKVARPQIVAIINEQGEIVHLTINNSVDLIAIDNENVETISLNNAIEIFKEKCKGTNYIVAEFGDNAKVIINEIRLSLTTVAKKDDLDFIRVMPVYDFIGRVYHGDDSNDQEHIGLDSNTMMTINAIDGSVIDRNLGY